MLSRGPFVTFQNYEVSFGHRISHIYPQMSCENLFFDQLPFVWSFVQLEVAVINNWSLTLILLRHALVACQNLSKPKFNFEIRFFLNCIKLNISYLFVIIQEHSNSLFILQSYNQSFSASVDIYELVLL